MKEEIEILSEPDEKVSRMLAGLKQVEAPKDFEFRLKARIASAKPSAYRTSYKKRFAYALPATAFAMISAFVVLNGNYFGTNQPTITTSMSGVPQSVVPVQQNQNLSDSSTVAANTAPVSPITEVAEIPPTNAAVPPVWGERKLQTSYVGFQQPTARRTVNRKSIVVTEPTLSADKTQESAPVIKPPGFSELPKNPPTEIPNLKRDFSIENDVLLQLGIETVTENGSLKVKSIKQNSPAERMGVKTDDLIETLDGEKVSGAPLRGKAVQVKKLGVKRGTEQIEMNLPNSQR